MGFRGRGEDEEKRKGQIKKKRKKGQRTLDEGRGFLSHEPKRWRKGKQLMLKNSKKDFPAAPNP